MRSHFISLLRYWDIIRFKTYANLKRDIDKTYLGTLWWIIEPLLGTSVYYLVITYILKAKTPVAFVLVGNVVYGHFSSSINGGANAIVGNAGILQQIQLPKSLYPIIAICNLTWKFLFSVTVVLPLLWLLHSPLSVCYLALPLLLAFQLFSVIAISLPLAILMPYFQDGRTLLATFLSMGVWLSGVVFASDRIPDRWLSLFYLNPAAPLIEAYRSVLLEAKWPAWSHFSGAFVLCVCCLVFGFWSIEKLGGRVAKLPM